MLAVVVGDPDDLEAVEILDIQVLVVVVDPRDLRAVRRELGEHHLRLRGGAAELAKRGCLQIEQPVVAAGVAPPHFHGVGKDQELCAVIRPRVVVDFEGILALARHQRRRRHQYLAIARRGIVADDLFRVLVLR